MDTLYYIVEVQDYGEVYEYEFSELESACYLMDIEQLPCFLWECRAHAGGRQLLDRKNTCHKILI